MNRFCYLLFLLSITLITGCGKVNENAPSLSATEKHPADWVTTHRGEYLKHPDQCRSCHGNELTGGITKIDCFNQAKSGQCHADGHGPRQIGHTLPFKDPALHGTMAKADLLVCQACHAASGGAGSNPSFSKTIGTLTAGCESSGCHMVNMAHPKPWRNHGSAGNQANACALCHGASFEGSLSIGSPSCRSCHKLLAAGVLPALGQCVSCHGNPPNGTTASNRIGSHTVHLGLSAMSGNCIACHTGGGNGTTNHSSTLTLTFATIFNANSGSATFNGTTCANISCHGGRTTPVWGGSLDVSANCTSCHQAGTTEYTSYNSGRHSDHRTKGVACNDCHDMTNTSAHFGNVTTKAFETPPYTTLRSYLRYDRINQSCSVSSPPPQGVQFTSCHGGTEIWKK